MILAIIKNCFKYLRCTLTREARLPCTWKAFHRAVNFCFGCNFAFVPNSQERGNLRVPFPQVRKLQSIKTKIHIWQRLIQFWLVVVLSGCLGQFGISFSTKSAQFDWPRNFLALPIHRQGAIGFQKRRRSSQETISDDPHDVAASYARYSSDQQREESNADQQRVCREAAEQNGHRILPEYEYSDEKVSGTRRQRVGLDALLRDAEDGKFRILYFHSLSRLARELVIMMPMLKRLVHVHGIRIISVTECIDSSRDNWEVIASIMSLLHERYVKELAANVFRGQEGTVLAGDCVGDYRLGYTSEPIPGSEKTRRGKNAKPRMRYVIEPVGASWVVRIFHWFVVDRRSLRWITRELNRLGAPRDHRASTPDWHHQQVADLLACLKYIGIWPWGETMNKRDPETGRVYKERRLAEDVEKWTRQFPHLRIIGDEIFEKAQQLLEENFKKYAVNRSRNGTFKGSKKGEPRHLLSGLIKCSECGSRFNVGGANSKYMFCPGHEKKGVCPCKTTLRRDRAERQILKVIGERILDDPDWFKALHEECLQAWKQREESVPTELAAAKQALADVERKITRLVDCVENGSDDSDIKRRLEQRRAERRELSQMVDKLKRSDETRQSPPTVEWIREQLRHLGECLNGDNPAAAYALRGLVGGEIVVTEIRRPNRKRFHLQGRFTIQATSVANAITDKCQGQGSEIDGNSGGTVEEIVIDFVEIIPTHAEAEKAKALYDQGLLEVEIAKILGCSKSKVTKLLRYWYESRGLAMPDGRSRRSVLDRKHAEAPLYQRISDAVKKLLDERLLLQEIAERLGCDRNTVTKAMVFWYESRGLEVPDGRARRKDLDRKVSEPRCAGD